MIRGLCPWLGEGRRASFRPPSPPAFLARAVDPASQPQPSSEDSEWCKVSPLPGMILFIFSYFQDQLAGEPKTLDNHLTPAGV